MGFAILRTQKLKSPVAIRRSMKHAFRAQSTPNADLARTPENTHIGAHSVTEAMAAFNAALPEKYRKNAVLAIEYLVAGSPEDMKAKSKTAQDAYFHDALNWLRAKHGDENVIYAGIHRDEATPHLYAYVIPKDPDSGKLNCRRFLGGAKALSEMQTDFAAKVGLLHGLERGVEGSKARHTTVQQYYAALNRPEHTHATSDLVEPKVLKKSLFTTEYEHPDAVAARIRKHYDPAIKEASVARLQARRAAEMAKTAQAKDRQLKAATGRLESLEGVFEGLTSEQTKELVLAAEAKRRENALEAEKKRRFEALPDLVRRAAGATFVFAQRALEAVKANAGFWRTVEWGKVEESAISEAVNEHGQSRRSAVEAVLKHSPGQAGVTPEETRILLSQVKETKMVQTAQQAPRGPRMR